MRTQLFVSRGSLITGACFVIAFGLQKAQAQPVCRQAHSSISKLDVRISTDHQSWLNPVILKAIEVAESKSWLNEETRRILPGFDVIVEQEVPGKEVLEAIAYFDPLARVSYVRVGSGFAQKDHETVTAHETGHLIFQGLAKGHLNQFQAINEFLADYFNWQVTGKEYIRDMVHEKKYLRRFSLDAKDGEPLNDLRGDSYRTVSEFLLRQRGSSFSEEYAASLFLTVGFIKMKKDPALNVQVDGDLKRAVEGFGNFLRQGGELARWTSENELWSGFGRIYAQNQSINGSRIKGVVDLHLFLGVLLESVSAERRVLIQRHFQEYGFKPEAFEFMGKWIQRVRTGAKMDSSLKGIKEWSQTLDSVDPMIGTREEAQKIVDLFLKEGHPVALHWKPHTRAVDGYAHISKGLGIEIVMGPNRITRLGLIATILHEVGHFKVGASEVGADYWMAKDGLTPFLKKHSAQLFPGQDPGDLISRAAVVYAESLVAFAGGNLNLELDVAETPIQSITPAGHPHPQQRWQIVKHGLRKRALPPGWMN